MTDYPHTVSPVHAATTIAESGLIATIETLCPDEPYALSWRLPPQARPLAVKLLISGTVSYSRIGPWINVSGTTPGTVTVALLGDLTGDWLVDGADLSILHGCWGTPCGDLNGDGTTDAADQAILLTEWTP